MFVGVDIGGTTVKIGVVDEKPKLAEVKEIKTDRSLSAREFADRIIPAVNGLKKKYAITELGVGIAGDVNYKEGYVAATANIPLKNCPAAKWFEEGTGIRTGPFSRNSARACSS